MKSIDKWLFYTALGFIVYMPLHVFIVQSASLLTGGIEAWKAAKDIFLALLIPAMLYVVYRRRLYKSPFLRWFIVLAGVYSLIHVLYLIFDSNDHNESTILATVYNLRLFAYLLLGYVIGTMKNAGKYLKILVTASVLIGTVVALFGVMQYFLPHDLLTNVGYSLERGVKPMFFIDDRPELPRVMSTLKDPNSFGAYLILPILFTSCAFFDKHVRRKLFIRPFRVGVLGVFLVVQLFALWFTFSRGALVGLGISAVTLLFIVKGRVVVGYVKRYLPLLAVVVMLGGVLLYTHRESQFVQDYVLHAAVSTNEADPNEKRVSLQTEALERIAEEPQGYGPGTAGLVSIRNPQEGFLTENYYLQIAYEVGWLGIIAFMSILLITAKELYKTAKTSPYSAVLFSVLIAYLFYSLLIHLWSNEAVALQWWLLAGVCIALGLNQNVKQKK